MRLQNTIRKLPHPVKKHMQASLLMIHAPTSRLRTLPDFLIIGAPRCGTTSLFHYMTEHQNVLRAVRKEIKFFSNEYHRGLSWYRRHFPLVSAKYLLRFFRGRCLTGEASTNYLGHPMAPKRIANILPQAKLIVMLRDPVERAYSDYCLFVKRGLETRSFEEALEQESAQSADIPSVPIHSNFRTGAENLYLPSLVHRYLHCGRYSDHLQHWFIHFPREQFLVIKSEEFYRNPDCILQQVFRFLNLPDSHLPEYEIFHKSVYRQDMSLETRTWLAAYFMPYNARLEEMLGTDYNWR